MCIYSLTLVLRQYDQASCPFNWRRSERFLSLLIYFFVPLSLVTRESLWARTIFVFSLPSFLPLSALTICYYDRLWLPLHLFKPSTKDVFLSRPIFGRVATILRTCGVPPTASIIPSSSPGLLPSLDSLLHPHPPTIMLSLFTTVALTAFSSQYLFNSVNASPCVAFDSDFNLYAFGLGGKDFSLGTQDTWTSMYSLYNCLWNSLLNSRRWNRSWYHCKRSTVSRDTSLSVVNLTVNKVHSMVQTRLAIFLRQIYICCNGCV